VIVTSLAVGPESTTLKGTVTSEGRAVEGASVNVEGHRRTAGTGKDGAFVLSGVPGGTQRVLVRKIGLRPTEKIVDVGREPLEQFSLAAQTFQMADVNITESALSSFFREVGFDKRRARGKGYFMTRADFVNKPGSDLANIFRDVPGLSIRSYSDINHPYLRITYGARLTNNPCFFVDGMSWVADGPSPGGSQGAGEPPAVYQFLNRSLITAVEVYARGMAPLRFRDVSKRICDADSAPTIVIWTRWRADDWSER
jgi:hypothetical protein